MYKLTEKDELRIKKQVNDIAYGNESWREFRNGATALFNDKHKAYGKHFVEREKEILCQTGFRSGNCNSCSACERCIADIAYKNAIEEIDSGLRFPPAISGRQAYNRKVHIWVGKNGTIHITQNM